MIKRGKTCLSNLIKRLCVNSVEPQHLSCFKSKLIKWGVTFLLMLYQFFIHTKYSCVSIFWQFQQNVVFVAIGNESLYRVQNLNTIINYLTPHYKWCQHLMLTPFIMWYVNRVGNYIFVSSNRLFSDVFSSTQILLKVFLLNNYFVSWLVLYYSNIVTK